MTLSSLGPQDRGQCPRCGERNREDPGSDRDLSQVRGGRVREAGWDQSALERDRVVADDASERARDRQSDREEGADSVRSRENTVRRGDARDSRAGRGQERSPASRVADLVEHEGGGQCQREYEQLGAGEEREEEPRQDGGIAPGSRRGDGSLTEENGPDEGRVRHVLGQKRRREHEPRRTGSEGRGRVPRGTGVGDRPGEQVRRDRRTREQERVERVGRCRRSWCVQSSGRGRSIPCHLKPGRQYLLPECSW